MMGNLATIFRREFPIDLIEKLTKMMRTTANKTVRKNG